MKRILRVLFFICLITGSGMLWASPSATVTPSSTVGCDSITAFFTLSSYTGCTGTPSTPLWYYIRDGRPDTLAITNDPYFTFRGPGTYTVVTRLICGTDTGYVVNRAMITVRSGFVVDFTTSNPTLDTSRRCGGVINFINTTYIDTTICHFDWYWVISGAGGVIANFTTYNCSFDFSSSIAGPGDYTISLIGVGALCGCVSSVNRTNYIHIVPPPTASFAPVGTTTFCAAPGTVCFNNTTTGVATRFVWKYSDGGTDIRSDTSSVCHTYTSPGLYSDTLYAFNNTTCSSSVYVANQVYVGGLGAYMLPIPGSVCMGTSVTFTDSTTTGGTPTSVYFIVYDVSRGTRVVLTASGGTTAFALDSAGTYTITDSAVYSTGCSATYTRTIRAVSAPSIGIITASTSAYSCHTPLTVGVYASPTGGTSPLTYTWVWSTAARSVFTTGTSSSASHTYTATGSYTVRLIVTDAAGCADSVTSPAFVTIDTPNLRVRVDSGCAPFRSYYSFVVNPPTITTYTIDSISYGDSTICRSGCLDTGRHTYATAGSYVIRVYWHLSSALGGCSIVSSSDTIRIGNTHADMHPYRVIAGTSIRADSICPRTNVFFNDSCSNCTSVLWNIHTTPVRLDTSQHDTTTTLFSYPGMRYYELYASVRGCIDTVMDSIYVYQPDTTGFIVASYNCFRRDSVAFRVQRGLTDTTLGILYVSDYRWDFGDSTTARDTAHGTRTYYRYPSASLYTITLTYTADSANHFCRNYQSFVVDRRRPLLTFTPRVVSTCRNTDITFTGPLNSDSTIAYRYDWYWGERPGAPPTRTGAGVGSTNVTTHAFSDTGLYTVRLVVNDNNLCPDSAGSATVTVFGPTGGFRASDTVICAWGSVTFTDRNVSRARGSTSPIVSRLWNFNAPPGVVTRPGAPPNAFVAGSSTETRTFPEGSYNVVLNDSDALHCYSRDSIRINSVKPHAAFTTTDAGRYICPNLPVTFRSSTRGVRYRWNFGDGMGYTAASDSDSVVTHIYTRFDSFITVSLIVISDGSFGIPAGCSDTLVSTDIIQMRRVPVTINTIGRDSAVCPPLNIFAYPTSSPLNRYAWNLYQGSVRLSSDTTFLFNRVLSGTGTYRLVIIGITARGCIDSTSRNFRIDGPAGYLTIDTTQACAAPHTFDLHFTDTSSTRRATGSFSWFACPVGAVTTTLPDLALTYTAPGVYCPPKVLIQDASCIVPITNLRDSIRVYQVPTITANIPDIICYGSSTFLTATGAAIGADSGRYVWSPSIYLACDTCATTSVIRPLVNTTYVVTGTTFQGCSSTRATIVTVDSPFHVTVTGKDTICIGSKDTLVGYGMSVGFSNYIWTGTGSSVYVGNPNIVSPIATTIYKAKATNAAGCTDSTTFKVTVLLPPVLHVTPDPAYVCKNADPILQLTATGANKYVWRPNVGLSCDSCRTPICTIGSNIIYTMVGTDRFGCRDSFFVPVTVYDTTVTSIRQDTSVCIGTPVQMRVFGGIKYLWTPSLGLSSTTAFNPIANPPVTTIYTVYITENVCFKDTLQVKINVVPIPVLRVPPSVTILAGSSVQLFADTLNSVKIVSYIWAPADSTLTCFECQRPVATPINSTTYIVKGSTIEGCTGYDSVRINIMCQNSQVFVPNTFTPNGDGLNDRFYVSGKGLGVIRRLAVYNRWGEMVFESRDGRANEPAYGWDGMYNGEVLVPDVYIYVLDIECQTGEPFSFKGDISLIR